MPLCIGRALSNICSENGKIPTENEAARRYGQLAYMRILMMIGAIRTPREATPERWRAAMRRAEKEGIEVRQLVGSGGWIATSGSDRRAAYELEVTGGVVHGCACPAASHDDPVCKHRAAFWAARGVREPRLS